MVPDTTTRKSGRMFAPAPGDVGRIESGAFEHRGEIRGCRQSAARLGRGKRCRWHRRRRGCDRRRRHDRRGCDRRWRWRGFDRFGRRRRGCQRRIRQDLRFRCDASSGRRRRPTRRLHDVIGERIGCRCGTRPCGLAARRRWRALARSRRRWRRWRPRFDRGRLIGQRIVVVRDHVRGRRRRRRRCGSWRRRRRDVGRRFEVRVERRAALEILGVRRLGRYSRRRKVQQGQRVEVRAAQRFFSGFPVRRRIRSRREGIVLEVERMRRVIGRRRHSRVTRFLAPARAIALIPFDRHADLKLVDADVVARIERMSTGRESLSVEVDVVRASRVLDVEDAVAPTDARVVARDSGIRQHPGVVSLAPDGPAVLAELVAAVAQLRCL